MTQDDLLIFAEAMRMKLELNEKAMEEAAKTDPAVAETLRRSRIPGQDLTYGESEED
tara:strand:+ start:1065 stop:1235 length:171 start_codon:yes stop_codon:yes gene_type:complete